jgi:V8-like Glu-specific endopeptidase
MNDLSERVSNQLIEASSQPAFGRAGLPASGGPEKVTAAEKETTPPPGVAPEAAPAINEREMLDAYWGSFGDDATRAKLRQGIYPAPERVVIGTDERRQVGNTQDYPWRCIASLRITANDGSGWIGTGWLVSPRLLLTAGHCVFMADHGGWAQRIEVIPGRQGDTFPFGSCFATVFRSVKGWTNNNNRDYDYGAIILPHNCSYGNQLGWFGYQVRADNNLRNLNVNLSGYPGDKPSGTQWFLSGAVKATNQFEFEYDIDTAGGQSGAPVWVMLDNGNRYSVGIHTNGSLAGNSATRITQEVFNNISAWVNEAP